MTDQDNQRHMNRRHRQHIGLLIMVVLICFLAFTGTGMANVADMLERQQGETEEKADSSGSHADESTTEEDAGEEPLFGDTSSGERSLFVLALQALFYLVVVLGMIYVLIRFLATRQRKMGQSKLFRNLGGITLGQNKSLQLVKVHDKIYLLGVADEISLIREISTEEEMGRLLEEAEEQDAFIKERMSGLLQAVKERSKRRGTNNPFQTMFEESLQKQKKSRKEMENSMSQSRSNEEGRST